MNVTLPPTSQLSLPLDGPLSSSESRSPARLSSERLQSAVEERLMARLSGRGSTIYSGDWKPHTTPAGRQIYRLRASAPRTSDSAPSSERSGWPTPVAQPANGTPEAFLQRKRRSMERGSASMGVCLSDINIVAQMAGWPTPQMRDFRSGGEDRVTHPDRSNNLNDFVLMAGWPTPTTRDHKGGYEGGRIRNGKVSLDTVDVTAQLAGWPTPMAGSLGKPGVYNPAGNTDSSRKTVELAGWPTPIKQDAADSARTTTEAQKWQTDSRDAGFHTALDAARLAGWPTPDATAREANLETVQKRREFRKQNAGQNSVPMYLTDAAKVMVDAEFTAAMGFPVAPNGPARFTADGQMLTGSSAAMESGGQLNPAHSRWLMGYPPEWCDCAVTATQSSRKQRRPSSSVSRER